MQRDLAYQQDIVRAAAAAQEYLLGLGLDAFLELGEKQDAVIRSLEVIGEAVRRLSDETKVAIPNVPWDRFRRLRNFLIHQYDNVDAATVYETVIRDLPPLEEHIRAFLAARPGSSSTN